MKICCKFNSGECRNEVNPQPLENFCKDKKRKDGLTVHCKSCLKQIRQERKDYQTEYSKRWRKDNPEKVIESRKRSAPKNNERTRLWKLKNPDWRLLRDYDITKEQYDAIYTSQGGACAICKTHQSRHKKRLHVDHCHDSKEVRGLL